MPAVIGPLQFLINIVEQVLLFFHDTLGAGWGLSIILMTCTVRAAMLPLTYKQFKGMREMQRITPEMKALQKRYKDDKERLGQEMQKLYKEHGVNPFASCLPLVAQFPFFISLFYMLRKDLKDDICGPHGRIVGVAKELGRSVTNTGCDRVDPGSAKFLFIHDVTAPAHGGTLVLLLALYVGSQLLSMLFMRTTAIDPNQRYLLMIMPFAFILFVRRFPAGLLCYWITTNLWTFAQGAVMRRGAPPVPAVNASADGKDEDSPNPLGALGTLFKPKPASDDASNGLPSGRSTNGAGSASKTREKAGATATAKRTSGSGAADKSKPKSRPAGPPPSSPRKKKKRSGRRR